MDVVLSLALRRALSGLGSFLIAAVAFFALSDRLGGWPTGVLLAGAMSGIVLLTLYGLISHFFAREQKQEEAATGPTKKPAENVKPPAPAPAPRRMEPQETLELGIRLAKEGLPAVVRAPEAWELQPRQGTQPVKPERGPVCEPGPYEVIYGKPARVDLSVMKGDRVAGRLEEKDDYDFDWFVVSEENLVKYLRGGRFEPAQEGSGENAYKILWEVLDKGPWTLVLETSGTQVIREVEVHLRLEED